MFALASMMGIVFVCFARHLTDWALPLIMVISWTLYPQLDCDRWCEANQEMACECGTSRLLWLLRQPLAAHAANPMRLPKLHYWWTPGSCRSCSDRAASTQPENEQSESRRGFLRCDEEDPCDGAEDIWCRFCKLHWAQQLGFWGFESIYILSIDSNHTCHICHLYQSIHPIDYRV